MKPLAPTEHVSVSARESAVAKISLSCQAKDKETMENKETTMVMPVSH
jgi:hypothetical protein